MRVSITVKWESSESYANNAAELGFVLVDLARHLLICGKSLEDFDEPLPVRDSHGDIVGRMTVTADAE
jgi:hypothetical protein